MRNRFLKALIDRVKLKGDNKIKSTVYWKAGFRQNVVILRWVSKGHKEKLWTEGEDKLIMELFPSAQRELILHALPIRSWKAITLRVMRLQIKRNGRPGLNQELSIAQNKKAEQESKLEDDNLILHETFPSGGLEGDFDRINKRLTFE